MSKIRIIREQTDLDKEDPNFLPSIVVKDTRVYVGGVHVFRDHLSLKELREYFPEEYTNKYRGEIECPICNKTLEHADGNTILQHCRRGHQEWYAIHGNIFTKHSPKDEGFGPVMEAIKATLQKEEVEV